MFGSVRPIQKGRWNWVTDKRVKSSPVDGPKRHCTAHRNALTAQAFTVASVMRTVVSMIRNGKAKSSSDTYRQLGRRPY